jgi:hypothetical protein
MSASGHENRSLSAAGPGRQLHPGNLSLDRSASIVPARTTALDRRNGRITT